MHDRKYELLLASVIAARATSFIFSKMILEHMDKFNLIAVRFIVAFLLLALVFYKRVLRLTKHELISGAVLGILFVIVMAFELTALKTADSSTVSLLENCSIIFVPLFEALLHRKAPGRLTVISAVTAMLGVFCLSAHHGAFSFGMVLALLAAVFYAFAIIATAKFSRWAEDSLSVGIVQVGVIGVFALALSFLLETPRLPATGSQWAMLLTLSVVCTGFGFTLQPVAQSRVSAERAAVFCAINPAIATLLGTAVLHERFGLMSALGLALILLSIALPHIIKPAKVPEKIVKN